MALEKFVNSYVDVAEAETYFGTRVHADKWHLADNTTKEAALVTATSFLDEYEWLGAVVSDDQPLAFPRYIEYFDTKLGSIIASDELPERVYKACFEMALHLLSNPGVINKTGLPDSLSVGPVSLSGLKDAMETPDFVYKIIKPLLRNTSKVWWRAN